MAEESNLHDTLSAAFDAAETPEGANSLNSEIDQSSESPAPVTEGRPRDEHGRFAKAEKVPELTASPEGSPAQTPEPQQAAPAAAHPVERPWLTGSAPPPGWSPAAKFEFDKLPQPVREAIAKRESEVEQGFAKFADYKPLEPFAEMARNSGTTLPEAVERYVGTEQALARDPVNTTLWLAQQYGAMDGLAQYFYQMFSGGQQAPQQDGQQFNLDPYIAPLREEIASIKSIFTQQREQAVNSQIQAFANNPAHKYFANVEDRMAAFMETGQANDLEDAYQQAIWSDPQIRPLLIKEQQAQQQATAQAAASNARRAAGSLPTGSPLNGATSPSGKLPANLRGALEDAWENHA